MVWEGEHELQWSGRATDFIEGILNAEMGTCVLKASGIRDQFFFVPTTPRIQSGKQGNGCYSMHLAN